MLPLILSGAKYVVLDHHNLHAYSPVPQVQKVFSSSLQKNDAETNSLHYLLEDARAYVDKPVPKGTF